MYNQNFMRNTMTKLGNAILIALFLALSLINPFFISSRSLARESKPSKTQSLLLEWEKKLLGENRKRKGLSLLVGGDLHFSWEINKMKNKMKKETLSLLPLFHLADVRAINLETSLSKQAKAQKHKRYIFNAHPDNVNLLKYLNINLVFLGNNHSMDMNTVGMKETLDALHTARIKAIGSGINSKKAIAPYIFKKNSVKYAIVSMSFVGKEDVFSTEKKTGVASSSALENILNLHTKVDQLIFSVHWGNEYFLEPTAFQRKWTRMLITKYKADLIIGHHPHIPQTIEIYNNVPIIYSLGNFIFGSKHRHLKHNILALIDWKGKNSAKIEKIWIIPIYGKHQETNTKNRKEYVRLLDKKELNDFWKYYKTLLLKNEPKLKQKLSVLPSGVGKIEINK